jgi:MoaA/NifB/PqqE/SkfB family radical SAM enzyme
VDYAAIKAANKELNRTETLQGKVRLKSRPLFFWFDIYGPCNLKCAHCGFQTYGRTSDGEVSDDVYAEVMRELMPTAYICNLGGTNWGEMTLSKKFHRFLLDAKRYAVRINLTTNGTRMHDDWFGDLVDTLDVIGFSMEGIEQEFEKMRGFKWRHFIRNVERICQARSDRGKTFLVEWRYCAHADSIHQLPEMIRLAKKVGVDRIAVMNLKPFVPEQKYKGLFYHRSLANTYFTAARKVARELDFSINIPPDFYTGDFDGRSPLLQIRKGPRPDIEPVTKAVEMVTCFRPWQACVVGELGDVRPCCVYWRAIGNLRKSGFESVWNGFNYRRLRASINTNPDSICFSCRVPKFDSEQNSAASVSAPTLRQLLAQTTSSVINRPRVAFNGVMDEDLDPRRR